MRPCGNIALAAVAVRVRLGFGMEVLRIRRWPPSPASPARRPRGVEDDAIRRAGRLRSLGARRLGATGQLGAASPSPRSPNVVREALKTTRFAAPGAVLERPKPEGSTCRPRAAQSSALARPPKRTNAAARLDRIPDLFRDHREWAGDISDDMRRRGTSNDVVGWSRSRCARPVVEGNDARFCAILRFCDGREG